MINREATIRWKGYSPDDLSAGSQKRVWANCDGCGKGRWVAFKQYRHFCLSCARRGENHPLWGKHHTTETKRKMSESHAGIQCGENHPNYGKPPSEETKRKLADANLGKHHSEETRRKMSEVMLGENHPNWQGGISFEPYCPKFNDAFKEAIREKFGRVCFLCPTTEEENGRKLCVHHVSYDKTCLCNGVKCKFVPLCDRCHAKTNYDRDFYESLITETLEYDF